MVLSRVSGLAVPQQQRDALRAFKGTPRKWTVREHPYSVALSSRSQPPALFGGHCSPLYPARGCRLLMLIRAGLSETTHRTHTATPALGSLVAQGPIWADELRVSLKSPLPRVSSRLPARGVVEIHFFVAASYRKTPIPTTCSTLNALVTFCRALSQDVLAVSLFAPIAACANVGDCSAQIRRAIQRQRDRSAACDCDTVKPFQFAADGVK